MFKYNKNAYCKQKTEHITFQEILSRIARKTGSNPKLSCGSYIALCPAHGDKNRSLSAREAEDGKTLLKCFNGCPVETICSAIDIRVKDLFPPKSRRGYRG